MLTKITLENFKSYKNAELPLSALTVLIGANASGKSNALEGLRLLSWLAQGQKLSSIQYTVNESEKIVRGRIQDLANNQQESFKIGCITNDPEWNILSMEIGIRDDELHIISEEMTGPSGQTSLYKIIEASKDMSTDVRVAYNNFKRGHRKPLLVCSDQLAIFTQLESAARFADGNKQAQAVIPKKTKELEKWLSNVLFLDPVPANMREYAFKAEKKLFGDGKNLSAILYGLWKESEENQKTILSFIQSLPEQDIEKLEFIDGPRGEVMVKLVETFGGHPREYDASLLSDGTLRVLAIAAAMLSAPESSLVIIEEIDNGVHPSRARKLLEQINVIAVKRGLRVLLSSHNPALLDALPDSAIPNVVFCYRDPQDGNSRLVQLNDLPDYPELIAQGTVGELMTSGILERFVKNHPGTEERKIQALEWLENLTAHYPIEETS